MKTVAVKIQFKNGNKSVIQVPVKDVVFALIPSYRGNIVELTPAAVKATCEYIEKRTGERPDKRVMHFVDLVEKGLTTKVVWTNSVCVVNKY